MRPSPQEHPGKRLAAGAVVSLALHAAAAGVFVSPGAAPLARASEPHMDAAPAQTRLGHERSQASTITWLGYETPSDQPHMAEQAEVEQAAMELALAQQVGEFMRSAADAATEARDAVAQQLERLTAQRQAMQAMLDAAAALAQGIAPDPGEGAQSAQQRAARAAAGAQGDADTPQDAAPTPGDAQQGDADRDSLALSLESPLRVVPGRPVTGEGLEVRTVRPRWGHTTTLTTRPGDAVVKVRFGPDGRVRTADLTRSTGVAFVDGPLMNAVYQWTASGKALAELEGGGPNPTLEVTFHIALR